MTPEERYAELSRLVRMYEQLLGRSFAFPYEPKKKENKIGGEIVNE